MMIVTTFGIVPPEPPPATKFFNVDTQIHNSQSISYLTMYGTISYPLITNGSPFLGLATLTNTYILKVISLSWYHDPNTLFPFYMHTEIKLGKSFPLLSLKILPAAEFNSKSLFSGWEVC